MIESPKRYTVTAALIYANGPIHIGHLAGCYLPADIYVRYLRSTGADVVFISGTDEHGVPITIKAKKEETTPQAVVDKYYKIISDSFEQFGISFDIYSRTSNKAHHKMSQDFFTTLYKKKSFTEETTEQYFDVKANQFLADRYIMGTCPNCGNENAYGDQCEKCGSTLSPEELINPRSTLSGDKPEKKATKNWYLPLDKLQGKLESYVNSHSEWKSNVFGQCQSWLKQGLHPRAMTRDLEWGVKVPVEGTDGKVLYVWFDAPIGYITFTEELFQQSFEERKNKLTKAHALNYPSSATHKPESWNLYWRKAQEKETKLVHFIGKDNIVFHCLIFPAMVMEHGDFLLADNVPANEFMNLENDKISTSRNWAVWLHEYLEEFPGKQDILRYTLCATAPETKDSDFTWADFQARNNNELVAIFGNFVNRAVVLTHKFYEGKIPAAGKFEAIDEQVIKELTNYRDLIKGSLENYRFREAQAYMIDLARVGNKYLADTEPWKLIKTDAERTATILNLSLQIAANLAIVAEPFLPFTAEKLVRMLKLPRLQWADAGRADLLKAGDSIAAAELLFEKIEDETIQLQVQKLLDTKKANELAAATVAPAKEAVSFDDFAKMDIRVATILTAEKVAKTKKLLKLTLDTGIDTRTVVSGIAEHYEPEKIIGQQVVMLANLAPREIKGIESKGMILMAEDKDGKLRFVTPSEAVSNGSSVA